MHVFQGRGQQLYSRLVSLPMTVEDDMMECTVSSLSLDIESKDNNISGSNWDPHLIKDALFDIIDHQPHLLNPSSSAVKKQKHVHNVIDEKEKGVTLLSKAKLENVFLPTYKEEVGGLEISGSKGDLVFPAFAVESSSEDIFKVWDLECSVGEGELVKQLNKALSANFIQPIPPSDDNLVKEVYVHRLSMGVADLSLRQGFGRIDHLTTGIADISLDQNSCSNFPLK